ncbi:penicillin-binding protein activator LpoB [Treponema pectinovorum]|uniref:penicillin-binding protein activator LpoB n=1 Tax=Treponema pectinovorum TaxID=164 RepID=UPI0011C6EA3C|nr:penicillin-binding protein activator LpoB [Treponema pectinovorum]
MKKSFFAAFALVFAFFGCASTSSNVERISSSTQTDLSGYWNDTDVRIVAENLINQCVNARAIAAFSYGKNREPVVILGTFKNQSDEHIDTSILSKKFEIALINSGKVDFVASSSERGEVRNERNEQQTFASEATAKSLANETGADFMLIGSVKTIVDSSTKQRTRTYYVTAELIDIETNRKLWAGEDSSIKKLITNNSYRY